MKKMNTKSSKIEIGQRVITVEPKRPELSNNGGDYYFGYDPVLIDGREVGQLQYTSAEFDFCEITGNFTRTRVVEVNGTDIVFSVDEQWVQNYDPEIGCWYDEEIDQETFIKWVTPKEQEFDPRPPASWTATGRRNKNYKRR